MNLTARGSQKHPRPQNFRDVQRAVPRGVLQRSELISAALAFVVVALWHWYATDWSEKNPRVNQQELQIITPDRKKQPPVCWGIPLGMYSRALFRRDGVEGRPALLDALASAVRAKDLAPFVVDKGQDPGEDFFAIVAEEFVNGAYEPPDGKQ